MDISAVLERAILGANGERQQAEAQLAQMAAENWVQYLGTLVQTLGDASYKTEVRMLAGLSAKNELTSKDEMKKAMQAERWVGMDPDAKKAIKQIALDALLVSDDRVASQAAQLVAAMADIDLPRNQWNELIPTIVENTKAEKPENVKRASLLTIGYICETLDPNNEVVASQSNGILIAIVQGAQSSETSMVVRKAALSALVSSLDFIASNFEREGERNFIMQVVCEATQANDLELQSLAFGALAKIMSLYYAYMGVYMQKALYSLSVEGMKSSDDRVACMAVEFWSTVCEEELAIQLDQLSDFQSFNFALIAINDVLPVLLQLLKRQNDDAEDDDWSVAMAAAACLQLFAQDTTNYVVQPTLQFVEQNITSANWREKEAAVMAFGSILDGPDKDQLSNLIGQALPPILQLINDDTLQVKDTVAWCLGRIADLWATSIDTATQLPSLLQALMHGLKDHPKVSTNCCWTLINLTEELCTDGPDMTATVMSQYYVDIIPILVQVSGKDDNEYSSRTSAYEALSTFVLYSSQVDLPLVSQIASEGMNRLSMAMEYQSKYQQGLISLGHEDRANLEELQSNILSLLTNVIRRMNDEIVGVADGLMEKFLGLLQIQMEDSLIEEDVFMAVAAVANALGGAFDKYMPAFLPFLTKALNNIASPVCDAAIGIVVDICHSLGTNFIPYCQTVMTTLGNIISSIEVRKELRPLILSCFGDIASNIGDEFVQYLDVVMTICLSAQSMEPLDTAEEAVEYVCSIQEAVLETYVGIVAGLHDNPQPLLRFLQQIFDLVALLSQSENHLNNDSTNRTAIGLIGDLAQVFQGVPELRGYFTQQWMGQYIYKVRVFDSSSQKTKDVARWAHEMVAAF